MLNHKKVTVNVKQQGKNLKCSLVTTLKEVRAGLYGKDGHAVEKPISQGIKGKVPEG